MAYLQSDLGRYDYLAGPQEQRKPRDGDVVVLGWRAHQTTVRRTRVFEDTKLGEAIELAQSWRREGLNVRAFTLLNMVVDLVD